MSATPEFHLVALSFLENSWDLLPPRSVPRQENRLSAGYLIRMDLLYEVFEQVLEGGKGERGTLKIKETGTIEKSVHI